MVRFIHAADIHLDSPLVGLARYEGAPVGMLRTATRAAFTALVDTAIAEAVDFLVISGDLYDGDWRDYNTGLFFCREMGRLDQAGIPAFLLYGNHDAKSELTKQLRLPKNVREFAHRSPGTFHLEHLGVALHGQSFRAAATFDNLAAGYPPAVRGFLNIGVLHTALEGHAAHDSYAPCAVHELVAKGYDYWALGHVHEYAVRHEAPWVVFPGNLQGRHIREPGERGAVLVTATRSGLTLERRLVDVLRWQHLRLDAGGAAGFGEVVDLASHALECLIRRHTDGRALAVRITLEGRSRAHGELFGLESQLRHEILARANAFAAEQLWIEKVCVATAPGLSADELAARSDALHDLQILLAAAHGDEPFLRMLHDELRDVVARCPGELLGRVPALEAIRAGRLDLLVEEAAPNLLARLAGEP